MARIILIETSTALCSTALAEDGRIVSYVESETPRAQASLTAPFVKRMLDGNGLAVRDCDAVCVSKGPGSYTGLRVGVSTAKGLCFGAGIPLIAVGTLDTLVYQAAGEGLLPEGCRYVVPMVDARRMEVYTALFTPDGRQLTETRPQVVESLSQPLTGSPDSPAKGPASYLADVPDSPATNSTTGLFAGASFADLLAEGPVLFIGDGAGKCRETLAHPNAHFAQCCPKASAMLRPAFAALAARRFEDTAYFEPFYLKEFIATVPRRKLF
jgi:tRNA threonylcarbamoyladenosine biosynthesis protein TsaB